MGDKKNTGTGDRNTTGTGHVGGNKQNQQENKMDSHRQRRLQKKREDDTAKGNTNHKADDSTTSPLCHPGLDPGSREFLKDDNAADDSTTSPGCQIESGMTRESNTDDLSENVSKKSLYELLEYVQDYVLEYEQWLIELVKKFENHRSNASPSAA